MKAGLLRLIMETRKRQQLIWAYLVFFFMAFLKLLPARWAMNFMDRFARFIGPKLKRQRLMMINLRRAFPEKSGQELAEIASDAWGAMGRMAAEYVYLDTLFDFDVNNPNAGRIEVSGIPIFKDLLENPRPFIVFTGHTGNFELLPVAGAAYGLDVTALFRPPNNPYIAEKIHDLRARKMGNLVPSHAGSGFALARQLEKGLGVGVLVDQKFHKGLDTTFFGLPVKTNPLVPKLVRQFNCDIFPARCVRLPGGRFKLEMEPAVEVPRKDDGSLDVHRLTQMLNDKVESWVREYPGQWLWYHDRWNIKHELDAVEAALDAKS
ncbi:lipid A biosynthesis lauroyl acyltransferase [Rhizobium sp. L1K21]|uniref:lipid A biosynthesis lauroyl acyltransferase n=1 Tax=Rhizobium sp. L1K21 TaxID=2954933 RepID=UPI002092A025|nr:lipid A biosynthesis lauroyl acyltransferase [Rhizobium sp. L1K21]MCO6185812.1 lipid A biosynthesis lauroyl acyltransferase [Rhizobium sp. L1K21]